MEVKVEEQLHYRASTSVAICNMCLSTDRRTCGVESVSCAYGLMTDWGPQDGARVCWECCSRACYTSRTCGVESVSYAYGLMTDWAPQDGARVCWECRALLARMLRFKVQALRAKEFLDAANVSLNGTDVLSGKCMSQLSIKRDYSFSASSPLPEYKPREVKAIPKKIELKFDMEDDDAWAEDLPDYEVKSTVEVEVPRLEVKPEESVQKKRPMKARVKWEVKRSSKGKKIGRTAKTEGMIEVYTVTMEELKAYKENASASMRSGFACKMCVEGFTYEVTLQKHNQRFHSEEAGTFICDVCTSRFKSKELLTQHRSKHFQMYRCRYPGCSYARHMRRNVQTHYKWHMEAEELQRGQRSSGDVFECDQCGKVFTFRRRFVAHLRKHIKKHLCELCSFRCSNSTQLKKHMLAHLDPSHRKYECEQCHKRFTERLKLTYHIRTHTGERPFQCETCGAKFVGKEAMTRHIKRRHVKSKSEVTKTFSQPRTKSLFINNRPYQSRITELKDPFTNKYECDICKKQITTPGNLRKHYYVHFGKILKCEDCNKCFQHPLRLQMHLKSIHKGEKPYQCKICGGLYATKAALDVHSMSHLEKPFKCQICNATFKLKINLSAHKTKHTSDKRHQCNICGESFTLKGNLGGHMKKHTSEGPHECNVCGKKFAWNRNLNTHLKTHMKYVTSSSSSSK